MRAQVLIVSVFLFLFFQAENVSSQGVDFGKGISYQSPDTTFKFKFNFRMQHLFLVDYNEANNTYSSQFLVRRARLKFGGYALSPKLEYKVELGLSNRDVSIDKEDGNTRDAARIILDAVLKWKFTRNWSLWVGQTKLPGNRERVVSSANLQFVDRSLLNSRLNLDRDMGLQLRGNMNVGGVVLLPSFAFSQGEGRNITSNNQGGFDYTLHLDVLPMGNFTSKGDYSLADLEREESPKIAIGLTYDHNDGAVRQGGQLGDFVLDSNGDYVENSLTTYFADLIFKFQGFSILTEYGTKSGNRQVVGLADPFLTGTAFNVQSGYLFANNFEVAVRFTTLRQDNNLSGISDEDQATLVFSKYVVGHSLKVQSDITQRTFPGSPDARYVFRAQVEMQF